MSYKLDSIKSESDLNFSRDCKALLDYIKKTWNVKAEPKGYKEFMKKEDRTTEIDEAALLKEFDGHDGSGTLSYSFPGQISLEMAAFDQYDQGRSPLETLVGAILGYGMLLGKQWGESEGMKEGNKKAEHLAFVASMIEGNTDPTDKQTYKDELNDFRLNPKKDWLEIASKWIKVRDGIEDDAFIKDLTAFMKGKKSKRFYDGDDEKMRKVWGHITYRVHSYGKDFKEGFYKKLETAGFKIKQGTKEFTLIRKD